MPGATAELSQVFASATYAYTGVSKTVHIVETSAVYPEVAIVYMGETHDTYMFCLVTVSVPRSTGDKVITFAVDKRFIQAPHRDWGSIDITCVIGSGNVPMKLMSLGRGEDTHEMVAIQEQFDDVLQALGLSQTTSSAQLPVMLTPGIVPLKEMKVYVRETKSWCGKEQRPVIQTMADILVGSCTTEDYVLRQVSEVGHLDLACSMRLIY